jgi:hypothetical protein
MQFNNNNNNNRKNVVRNSQIAMCMWMLGVCLVLRCGCRQKMARKISRGGKSRQEASLGLPTAKFYISNVERLPANWRRAGSHCRLACVSASVLLPMTASGQPVQTSSLKTRPLQVRSFFRRTRCSLQILTVVLIRARGGSRSRRDLRRVFRVGAAKTESIGLDYHRNC